VMIREHRKVDGADLKVDEEYYRKSWPSCPKVLQQCGENIGQRKTRKDRLEDQEFFTRSMGNRAKGKRSETSWSHEDESRR